MFCTNVHNVQRMPSSANPSLSSSDKRSADPLNHCVIEAYAESCE